MFDPMKDGWEAAAAMMRMWSDMASRTIQAADPQRTPPDAARDVRNAIFKTWAEAWDQAVRTPEFLEMMRVSLGAGAQWRKFWIDFFNRSQEGFLGSSRQGVEQAMSAGERLQEQMMSAGQRWQEQMLSAMEAMNAQVRRLCRRMDVLERDAEERRERLPRAGQPRRKKRLHKPAGANGED